MKIDRNASRRVKRRIFVLTQSWEPEETPPQRRMRRFVDACLSTSADATVICAPPNPINQGPDDASRYSSTSTGSSSVGHLSVIRTFSVSSRHSLLVRMIDQLTYALSGAALGIVEGVFHGRPPTSVVATVPSLPTALAGYLISRWFRVPFVIDLRDAWPELATSLDSWAPPARKHSPRHFLAFSLVRIAIRAGGYSFESLLQRSDRIITTSARLTKHLEARGYTNAVTIRNAFDPSSASTHRQISSESGPKSVQELKVLYAGTVGRAQGLSNALQALKVAVDNGAAVRLRIIGSGAEMGIIRRQSAELGLNVEIFDRVPQSEMETHYSWCDTCLIHLQDWPPLELTIPSKLVEVMARHIPACVSANGEPAEIVDETKAGQAVPAMKPNELANLWIRWAKFGVPIPDTRRTDDWIRRNAHPRTTSEQMVAILTTI